jgi:hypothetical protein
MTIAVITALILVCVMIGGPVGQATDKAPLL